MADFTKADKILEEIEWLRNHLASSTETNQVLTTLTSIQTQVLSLQTSMESNTTETANMRESLNLFREQLQTLKDSVSTRHSDPSISTSELQPIPEVPTEQLADVEDDHPVQEIVPLANPLNPVHPKRFRAI